jgi:GNAT superfamily N-acetyltransferase
MTVMTAPATATAARLRILADSDVASAARLLGRSFDDDPGSVVFVDDPQLRLRLNELSSARALRAALPHASAYGAEIDEGLAGVAIWHPPGTKSGSVSASVRYARALAGELPELPPVVARLATTLITDLPAARRLTARRRDAVRRASSGASWHLAVLATDAAYRGRGVARLLIEHVLHRCDADGLPAWLETTNPVNPAIYERFGFTTVAEIGGGRGLPTWWVMRREPRIPDAGSRR